MNIAEYATQKVTKNTSRKRNYNTSRKFAHRGHHFWSVHDIEAVIRHDVPDRELGKRIGRSIQAIQIMRSRIKTGKIVLR